MPPVSPGGELDHVQRLRRIAPLQLCFDLVGAVDEAGQGPLVALEHLDEPQWSVLLGALAHVWRSWRSWTARNGPPL